MLLGQPGTASFLRLLHAVRTPAPDSDGCSDAIRFACDVDWAALSQAPAHQAALAAASMIGSLDWVVPYSGMSQSGKGFRERSAFAALPTSAGRGDIAAGLFIVGPNVEYNDHQHEPAELYLPLAGIADYWTGSGGWRRVPPGTAIVHPAWEWHAMGTAKDPVLIFWMWIGITGGFVMPDLRTSFGGDPR